MPIDSAHRPLYEVKANLFKGLAHPLRIRILELVTARPGITVAELQSEMDIEASHLSQHLAVLRRHRLVTSERRGSHVHYSPTSPQVGELLASARGLLLVLLAEDSALLGDASSLPELGGDAR